MEHSASPVRSKEASLHGFGPEQLSNQQKNRKKHRAIACALVLLLTVMMVCVATISTNQNLGRITLGQQADLDHTSYVGSSSTESQVAPSTALHTSSATSSLTESATVQQIVSTLSFVQPDTMPSSEPPTTSSQVSSRPELPEPSVVNVPVDAPVFINDFKSTFNQAPLTVSAALQQIARSFANTACDSSWDKWIPPRNMAQDTVSIQADGSLQDAMEMWPRETESSTKVCFRPLT